MVRSLILVMFIVGVGLIRLLLEVFSHYGRRAIVPRTVYIQIRGQLRSELGKNFLSIERIFEGVVVEILHHLVRDDDGVLRLPWFWTILQNAELDGKGAALGFDEGVHSTRVGIKLTAITGARHLQRLPDRCPQSQ